ncbi:Choline dehydrogenase [Pseudomonas cuatrocienegasensis]|uniref:Choline dehydrogenase n=1 Tax=Pseudomonas cuatrocienegasensis TaxID=543360 RepID=A0ABY1BJ62_9PSED|nr:MULTISPECIES: GMC family oxidoreductase [Pseudomonas]OEC35132.1 GMC family oxidoreductase [Pseudomonas sp. 21C1]SEQ99438.1 Choline dehydrogenase [Pseudomonas cuatrocienegasensis]
MIRDYQSQKELLELYDVCIVGGGPAGITLALRLAGNGWRVALVEGGGHEYSARSQALYQSTSSGLNAYVDAMRLRFLGGTSNHWTGRCRPFERSDFAMPTAGGLPGWPIAFSEIEHYLAQAMDILDLPAKSDFKAINEALPGGDFDADRFLLSPPTRFAQKYDQALRDTEGLDVFINCNCVDLDFASETGEIAAVVVSDYDLRRGNIKARHYVLAAGAIENARQLLNSESLLAAGVTSQDGITGSCFMEHLNIDIGTFILAGDLGTSRRQYFTTDAFIEKHQVGKGNMTFSLLAEVKSYGRTAAIKDFFKNIACEIGVADKVDFIAKFNCPGDGLISTLIEQVPNQKSRVSLLDERDGLGVRKANLHWELSPEDRKTIKTLGLEVAKRFSEAGLGFVKLHENIYDIDLPLEVNPHAHHMGTTRMAETAEYGVVDKNCKVFGVDNLYVAGSSIFATGGACNPTMPILQLALRLADHLDERMKV